jgi:hypothetical protein
MARDLRTLFATLLGGCACLSACTSDDSSGLPIDAAVPDGASMHDATLPNDASAMGSDGGVRDAQGPIADGSAEAAPPTDASAIDSGATDSSASDATSSDAGSDAEVDAGSDGGGCGACSGTCALGRCLVTLYDGTAAMVNTTDLSVVGGTAYWVNINSQQDTVMETSINGGTATVFDNGPVGGSGNPITMTADANNVYWAESPIPMGAGNTTLIMSEPLAGGTPTTLTTTTAAVFDNIAVGSSGVYWTNDQAPGTLFGVGLSGGTAQTLASGGGIDSQSCGIAVQGANIYSMGTSSTPVATFLLSVPVSGGAPTKLWTSPVPNGLLCVAVDAASVYWTDGAGGTVNSLPFAGGTPTVIASGQSGPADLVVDGTSVYWLDTNGSVMKAPIGGGPAVTLATGQGVSAGTMASAIAVDATSVYWTQTLVGKVMKLTPK